MKRLPIVLTISLLFINAAWAQCTGIFPNNYACANLSGSSAPPGAVPIASFPTGITALTGNVTASGTGSVVATIAANAVTFARFQQVAASSLVGNATGSLANVTGITLGSTLAFSGSALQTGAGTGDVSWSANAFVTAIGATKVTSAMLNADVFSTAHSWAGIQTLATPVFTGLPTGTGVATANTVSTLVARDGSGNFAAGTITAALTGNATTATTSTNATNTAITDDTTTNATMYPTWVTTTTGNLPQKVSSTKLTFNPSTATLTTTTFSGALTGNASSATILATTRSIYGNNFDGSAALGQIIASTFGGTGNGFAKLSGPATSEKTYTLPNASVAILTDNAAVTVAQGGTGLATLTLNNVMLGNGTSTPQFVAPGTSGNILTSNGTTWASAAAPAASAVTVGSTTIGSGATTRILYDNAGVLGEYTISGTGTVVAMQASPTFTGTVGAAAITMTGQLINSLAGAASTPPATLTGTWFSGGSATTTKPQLLVEQSTATSTGWNTSGTGIGVNSTSSFVGRYIDVQKNGTSKFFVDTDGVTTAGLHITNYFDANVLNGAVTVSTAKSFGFSTNNDPNNTGAGWFYGGTNTIIQGVGGNIASPIAQTYQAQGSRPGTDTNTAGGNLTITSGGGTGNSAITSLIFQSPIAVGSGTGAQTQTTGLTIKGGMAVMPPYTVSTLPTGITGGFAYVTDAVACTFLAAPTGGGSTYCPVTYTGAAWVAH